MDIETATPTDTTPSPQAADGPKVSIGMPVYNGEAFIREALDSLLAQTFTDFELIISDNASTDGTEAICREYAAKDERIRYLRQAENRGAPANFQCVLDEAVGEYFMWAAADDWWEKTFIQTTLELHEAKDYGNCFTRYCNLSRRFRFLGSTKIPVIDGLDSADIDVRISAFWRAGNEKTTANFFYGLWRKKLISEVWRSIEGKKTRCT